MTRSGRIFKQPIVTPRDQTQEEPVAREAKDRPAPPPPPPKRPHLRHGCANEEKTKADASIWEIITKSPVHRAAFEKAF